MKLTEKHQHEALTRLCRVISASLLPPRPIRADAWAEENLVLSEQESLRSGPFRLRPWQREVLCAMTEKTRTVCCFGVQLGKTTLLQASMGFEIDQDPGPMMFVYPTGSLAKRRSRKHLQPLITGNPALARHLTGRPDDFQIYEYMLDRMSVNIVWAGSPSELAAEPVKYLKRDEIDKFPGETDAEADAMSLSEMRTESYGWTRRIVDVSTPTTMSGPVWGALLGGTYRERYLPCPSCGEMQVLKFRQIKYPDRRNDEDFISYQNRVKVDSYYECAAPGCGHRWTDHEINAADERGEWRANNPDAPYESFHLWALYSPMKTVGEIASAFVAALGDRPKMHNFVNSILAEPWRDQAENAGNRLVLLHRLGYERGTVPTDGAAVLFLFIDVQKDYVWYDIWAHTATAMYNVDHGQMATLEDRDELVRREFRSPSGRIFTIQHTFIDSAYRTLEVYLFCLARPFCTPLRGQESMTSMIRYQVLNREPGDQGRALPGAIKLLHINVTQFLEELLVHLHRGYNKETDEFDPESADWFLPASATDMYASHITGKSVRETTDKTGRVKREWITLRPRHDLLDTAVYNLAARYVYLNDIRKISASDGIHSGATRSPSVVATF